MTDWSDLGTAKKPQRARAERARPVGACDDAVDAVGKVSEAMEKMEVARGHLYAFHQLSGATDLALQDALRALRDAGFEQLALAADEVLVGRDVAAGRWTYQLIEDYEDNYASVFREVERRIRDEVMGGVRHVYESEMQLREQSAAPTIDK